MDFSILLYFSTIFYAVQCSSNLNSNIEELKRLIADSKKQAQAITSDIDRFSMELQFMRNSELDVPVLKNKQMLSSILQAADNQFNIDVKEALKKGKNEMKVTRCLKQAKTVLTSIEAKKENAFKKCHSDGATTTAAGLHPLRHIFQRGNNLIGQLNSLLARCENANIYAVQTSIGARFRELNNSVNALKAAAIKNKEGIKMTFNNAFKTFKECNGRIINAAKFHSDIVTQDLNVCLHRA